MANSSDSEAEEQQCQQDSINCSMDLFSDDELDENQHAKPSSGGHKNPIENCSDSNIEDRVGNNVKETILIDDSDEESSKSNSKQTSSNVDPCHLRNNDFVTSDNLIETKIETPSSNQDSLESESQLSCPFCHVNESSLYRLEFHVATSHPDGELLKGSEDTITENQESEYFFCPLCDMGIESESALECHIQNLHSERDNDEEPERWSCPLCTFTCKREYDLGEHVRTHRGDHTFYAVSEGPEAAAGDHPCPLCAQAFSDADLLTSHVDIHFSEDNPTDIASKIQMSRPHTATSSSTSSGSTQLTQESSFKQGKVKGVYDKQFDQNLERAVVRGEITVSDYHVMKGKGAAVRKSRHIDDGQTRVEGLIQKISGLFSSQGRPGQSVMLCDPTDHYSGSFGDKGWGCGYRNIQMMMSCLVQQPQYEGLINTDASKAIPSIPRIQEMIESAWQKGFDPQGCQQLNGRLANTKKWIGATEIVALFSSLKIRCHLADFSAPSSPDGSHPRLMEWATHYFTEAWDLKPPLYLQHQGHSRSIVGVEKDKGATKLLLFDPGSSFVVMDSIANAPLTWKQMRSFRRTTQAFKSRQYQVVAVTGVMTTDTEYQQSKTIRSERVV